MRAIASSPATRRDRCARRGAASTRSRRGRTVARREGRESDCVGPSTADDEDTATMGTMATTRRAIGRGVMTSAIAWTVGPSARAIGAEMTSEEWMKRAGETFGDVKLEPYVDVENGYALLVPEGWVKDLPNGISEIEFHPLSEYGGRRFKVQVRPYGRTRSNRVDELEDAEYASPRAYAESVARKYAPLEGEGSTNRGQAVSKVLSSRMSDDGRFYFFEYSTESMLPLHFWGVIALGPGPVGSARKLGRKDLIALTCQMPEDKGPEAAALLEHIVTTFRILDDV